MTTAVRIILLHYDQIIELPTILQQAEFFSVINTSQKISQLLAKEVPLTLVNDDIETPAETHSKKVLLVDDNLVNLKLACELIRLWGHEVTPADHGSKALELFDRQTFDLIILDIQMPDIDGVSLLYMMRENKPDDQTPVVALTANVLNDEAGRLIELGFDYFLSKPIDEDKFRGLLGSDTQRQQADSAGATDSTRELDCSVDYARSLALSADNESLLKQIFEILQRDIPDQQMQLASALAQQDHDRLSAIAHKLHGVTCYASLPRLRHKVLGFQQRLARDSNTPLDQSVQELSDELEAIKKEVDRYLEHLDATGVSS
jgi:two-component system sensor histidine kinase BarA